MTVLQTTKGTSSAHTAGTSTQVTITVIPHLRQAVVAVAPKDAIALRAVSLAAWSGIGQGLGLGNAAPA